MAQFKFKLEAVLKHRKSVEKEKLRDFSHAAARLKEIEDQVHELNRSMQETNDDVRKNRLVGRLDVSFITAHRRYLVGMQKRGADLVREMAERQKAVDVARAALAEAARQTKILEKLREGQQARWKEELDRKELAQMDEAGMQLGYAQLQADLIRMNESST